MGKYESVAEGKMAGYRAAAGQRRRVAERQRLQHWERAQAVAREAAQVLRSEFGAGRIVVFGSAASLDRFRPGSDLDLGVWGLDDRLYLRAVARLLSIDVRVSVDLVEVDQASPSLRSVIEQEGVEF